MSTAAVIVISSTVLATPIIETCEWSPFDVELT